MKFLALLIFLSLSNLIFAQKIEKKVPFGRLDENFKSLSHGDISFKYKSFDGQIYYNCKHNKINQWGDWKVYCGENLEKKFSARVALRKYTRPRLPKTSFEVLFWITNKSTSSYEGTGTTFWFHLKDVADYQEVSVSQATDNDTAGLYLTIDPK